MATVSANVFPNYFDRNDPKYKSCCCHVKIGTLVIGILDAILVGIFGVLLIFIFDILQIGGWVVAVCIIILLIPIATLICLFVGVAKEKAPLLLPHLILKAIYPVLLGILSVVNATTDLGSSHTEHYDTVADDPTSGNSHHYPGGSIAGGALNLALQIWFFIIVLKCYRFFADQEKARCQNTTLTMNNPIEGMVVQMQVPPPMMMQAQASPVHLEVAQLPPPPYSDLDKK